MSPLGLVPPGGINFSLSKWRWIALATESQADTIQKRLVLTLVEVEFQSTCLILRRVITKHCTKPRLAAVCLHTHSHTCPQVYTLLGSETSPSVNLDRKSDSVLCFLRICLDLRAA